MKNLTKEVSKLSEELLSKYEMTHYESLILAVKLQQNRILSETEKTNRELLYQFTDDEVGICALLNDIRIAIENK